MQRQLLMAVQILTNHILAMSVLKDTLIASIPLRSPYAADTLSIKQQSLTQSQRKGLKSKSFKISSSFNRHRQRNKHCPRIQSNPQHQCKPSSHFEAICKHVAPTSWSDERFTSFFFMYLIDKLNSQVYAPYAHVETSTTSTSQSTSILRRNKKVELCDGNQLVSGKLLFSMIRRWA